MKEEGKFFHSSNTTILQMVKRTILWYFEKKIGFKNEKWLSILSKDAWSLIIITIEQKKTDGAIAFALLAAY